MHPSCANPVSGRSLAHPEALMGCIYSAKPLSSVSGLRLVIYFALAYSQRDTDNKLSLQIEKEVGSRRKWLPAEKGITFCYLVGRRCLCHIKSNFVMKIETKSTLYCICDNVGPNYRSFQIICMPVNCYST